MNKLYVIKFILKGDFCISTYNCWNPSEAKAKMDKNPEWNYEIVEDNNIHCIIEGRQRNETDKANKFNCNYC